MQRTEIGALIAERLEHEKAALAQHYAQGEIPHFIVDDLLAPETARAIYEAFPAPESMMLRRSLREVKYVTSQMDRCAPLLEEIVFAFQDPRVVRLVSEITGISAVEPDAELYAGGVSLMGNGHFLNPHIDNSHDKARARYRALNLLYYVSPDWGSECGGNLELWPRGSQQPLEITSLFNRLVVMATGRKSWHSVNPVLVEHPRCCVSNYYFSARSPEGEDYFHVTSFRARPGQYVRQVLLAADVALRMGLRRAVPGGLFKTRHFYRRGHG